MTIKWSKGFTLIEIIIVVAIIGMLAALAVPSFRNSTRRSKAGACINNLRQIDTAKERFALASNIGEGDAIVAADITDYIKRGFANITCPAGGNYTIGVLGVSPSCTAYDATEHDAVFN